MKNKNELNYNEHYESILSIEKDQGKINAYDFINFFSELVIKHSATIENKTISQGENN